MDTEFSFSNVIDPSRKGSGCRATSRSRDVVIDEYRKYLLEERGLVEESVQYMCRHVDQFLATLFPDNKCKFARLTVPEITKLFTERVCEMGGEKKALVTSLRSFFRYLRHRGDIETDLAGCIPAVHRYALSTLPRFLPPGSIEQVLKQCDRSTPVGRRNYAILLLLARLGLRAGEIVTLTLDDVDWDLGQITVRGKGGRTDTLPLPADAGAAVAEYLRCDRPQSSSRRVFLGFSPAGRPLSNHGSITSLVKEILVRAGVKPQGTAAHAFRHTLATEMLQRGASLGEIGEVLRHRCVDSTRIYAKVDLPALRKLALAWPGGAR